MGAEIVLYCEDLEAMRLFFCEQVGMRTAAVFPADAPRVARVVGFGLQLRLEQQPEQAQPIQIRINLPAEQLPPLSERLLRGPDGTRVEYVDHDPPVPRPQAAPKASIQPMTDDAWEAGRAGMLYRDLIPDRWGGSVIASHIRIPQGGPVPDYVHFHKIHFQLIYCLKGEVTVVYEDQGPPFLLKAGDCVLQPPRIRHRVLESSDGLEVLEIGAPAEHETLADLVMELPNDSINSERLFAGQRFVRHQKQSAVVETDPAGYVLRDLGLDKATDGKVSVRVVSSEEAGVYSREADDNVLYFAFITRGNVTLSQAGEATELATHSAIALPGAAAFSFQHDGGAAWVELIAPRL